ncbi:hypothetical protein KPL39_02175 [Clostridium gasigenes]|uniref:hypothetical protein n=1 Tax=Clostridium gasigenes TaxID=94869 RepID=UPI001C0D37F6|nr:hypothetical protein [Clostridium gasigenes]MBU3135068.1 hypothetical protein [Clostridium gasigenes]
MNYDDFLDSTPRIISSLNDLEIRWQEHLQVGIYIKTHCHNEDSKDGVNEVDSFRDLVI